MSQHILQLQFDDDGDLDDDIGDDDVNDVSDLDDDDIGDDGDDDGDDDGKEAKTTPGSDLYWPALPGASGGIKPSELYCSNIRNVVSIYQVDSTSMDLPSTVCRSTQPANITLPTAVWIETSSHFSSDQHSSSPAVTLKPCSTPTFHSSLAADLQHLLNLHKQGLTYSAEMVLEL